MTDVNCQCWVDDYYFGPALTASDRDFNANYYFGPTLMARGGNFNGDNYFGQALAAST